MRLRASLLCDSLNVKSILAMTATATKKTLLDVMSALDIPPANLIQAAQLRDNFQLSVSMSENRQVPTFLASFLVIYTDLLNKYFKYMLQQFDHSRMKHLMALLRSSPYKEITSIIIYCKYKVCIFFLLFVGFCKKFPSV